MEKVCHMNEKMPFEEMFEKMTELLRFLESKAGKPIDESKITPEFLARLAKLEKDVQEFARLGNRIVTLSEEGRERMEKSMADLSETAELNEAIYKLAKISGQVVEVSQDAREKIENEVAGIAQDPWKVKNILEKAKSLHAYAQNVQKVLQPESDQEESHETPESEESFVDDTTFRKRRRRKLKRLGDENKRA